MRASAFATTSRRHSTALLLQITCLILTAVAGCGTAQDRPLTLGQAAARDAATPILEFEPDANWTQLYNRLVDLGDESIRYLAGRREIQKRVAPDNLRAMATLSLLRMLIDAPDAPRLSVRCYETTFDLMHLNLKVRGQPLGVAVLGKDATPERWHDLFPGEFDDSIAAEIDVEADRQLLLEWLATHSGRAIQRGNLRRLDPRPEALWPVLSRRYANIWTFDGGRGRFMADLGPFDPSAANGARIAQRGLRWGVILPSEAPLRLVAHASTRTIHVDDPPSGQMIQPAPLAASLIQVDTEDYNLVRAACIWLGESSESGVLDGLIIRVGHPSEVVAHNAKFALRFSRDPRIRELMERYKHVGEETPADAAPSRGGIRT